jgi:hypothetical protein
MSEEAQFDAAKNITSIAGNRIVFHCHHYNVFLQRTIEEALGEGAVSVQRRAAVEASRRLLEDLFRGDSGGSSRERRDRRDRLEKAAKLFGSLGFGLANIGGLTVEGGSVVLATSHYAIGWKAKFGPSAAPVCHFAVGYWAAALAVAAGVAPERVLAHERRCAAAAREGDEESCSIDIEVL